MKRLSTIALAALLAACETYPPDPYGYPDGGYPGGGFPDAVYPPYGEPGPYPGEPYPPYGEPYPPYPGQSYPPTGTYPGQPYPSAPPYSPYPPNPPTGQYPPTQQPYPGGCPIAGSSDWRAWINRMPGNAAQTYLFVSGKVTTSSGGYSVGFEPSMRIAESYPAQAFAALRVVPPSQGAIQVIVTHNVRQQWPISQSPGRVVIECGGRVIADISPVQSAQ